VPAATRVKIAHLVIAGDVAGGQIVALRLALAARDAGHEPLFLVPGPGPFVDLLRAEELGVHTLDLNRLFRVRGAVRLREVLRRERVDVLHTHTAVAANVVSRVVGRLAGVKVVSHMHIENHFRANPVARALYSTLDTWSARLASAILVVSDDTRRALERQGYPPASMETVHNGIEIPQPAGSDLRDELGVPADAPLVGSVARLCDVKGQRELIDALALLADGSADTRLLLVGDDLEAGGGYRRALEQRAEERGVRDRVLFTGHRGDVPSVLATLDVFVLPSWIEGLPMTVLEAMAHSRPVVATPVGGTAEAVADGETGLLVPPRDPQRLAEALHSLIADPDRARAMGEAGYRRVAEHFDARGMERRVLDVYDRLAA
jgi:glycosyltransferase involved in cell wall biosynthesis